MNDGISIQILGPAADNTSPDQADHFTIAGSEHDDERVWVAPDPNYGGELRFHAKGRKTTLPLPKPGVPTLMRFPPEK